MFKSCLGVHSPESMKYSLCFSKTCYKQSRKSFSSSSAKIVDDLISVIDRIPGCKFPIRGHPFMTSTRRGSGSGGRMCTGVWGQAPCGRPHRKLKLESTDIILTSPHEKKFHGVFLPEFRLCNRNFVKLTRKL